MSHRKRLPIPSNRLQTYVTLRIAEELLKDIVIQIRDRDSHDILEEHASLNVVIWWE